MSKAIFFQTLTPESQIPTQEELGAARREDTRRMQCGTGHLEDCDMLAMSVKSPFSLSRLVTYKITYFL